MLVGGPHLFHWHRSDLVVNVVNVIMVLYLFGVAVLPYIMPSSEGVLTSFAVLAAVPSNQEGVNGIVLVALVAQITSHPGLLLTISRQRMAWCLPCCNTRLSPLAVCRGNTMHMYLLGP